MLEAEIYPTLKAWLENHGWNCYGEVCCYSDPWPVDVVAKRPGNPYLLAVEMKTGFTKGLLKQGGYLSMFALYPYIAAPTQPRRAFLDKAYRIGVGVLRVRNGVTVILKPRVKFRDLYHFFWRGVLKEISGAGNIHATMIAGVPNGGARPIIRRTNN